MAVTSSNESIDSVRKRVRTFVSFAQANSYTGSSRRVTKEVSFIASSSPVSCTSVVYLLAKQYLTAKNPLTIDLRYSHDSRRRFFESRWNRKNEYLRTVVCRWEFFAFTRSTWIAQQRQFRSPHERVSIFHNLRQGRLVGWETLHIWKGSRCGKHVDGTKDWKCSRQWQWTADTYSDCRMRGTLNELVRYMPRSYCRYILERAIPINNDSLQLYHFMCICLFLNVIRF